MNQRIVLVGGGTGVYQVVLHLKHICRNIATIQTMFDGGGYSGKLRDEIGILPPGDIVRAILAGADDSLSWSMRQLFSYRFNAPGTSLERATWSGFTFAALCKIHHGNVINAIQEMCQIAHCKIKVLPVTVDNAHLCARLDDSSIISGEGFIDCRPRDDHRRIESVYLDPGAQLFPGAGAAIVRADKVVFCPGSLFTSVIPNALVSGFSESLEKSRARKIMVINTMTNKSETDGFKASDFARELLKRLGIEKFDAVICNRAKIRPDLLEKYAQEQSYPVKVDRAALERCAHQVIVRNVVEQGEVVRHGSKLASIISEL